MAKVTDEIRDERRLSVALKIADQLRKREAVWQQEFNPVINKEFALPYNVETGRRFSGYNMMEIFANKQSNEKIGPTQFFTFEEAKNENWIIKKNATAIPIEHHVKFDMGYKDIVDKDGKKTKEFYKEKTEKPILYNQHVFSLKDLQGEYKLPYPESKINTAEAIENILKNTDIKIVNEKGLQKSFYATKRNEIHIAVMDENKKDEYYSNILRHVAKAAGKEGRAFGKELEGYSAKAGDLAYVKNKFITELAAMQLSMRMGLPYEPQLSEFESKQIAGLIEKKPINLVIMANESSKVRSYVMKNIKEHVKDKDVEANKAKETAVSR